MTPVLMGRWQTRLFAVIVAGGLWTAVLTPFLPAETTPPGATRLGDLYLLTATALVLTAGLGVVIWDPLWHLLQQFRWEKDWPALFVLLQAVPEGALVHWVLGHVVTSTGLGWPGFLLDFGTTWLVVFTTVHGPMRVLFIRWRFRGGRIL